VPSRSGAVFACCSTLYANPLAELLIGDSLHPGGLASTRELLRASELGPGARLLDAGCGLGTSSRLAADTFCLVVDGVDGSAEVIGLAASRGSHPRIRWIHADLAALPFGAGTFDGILAECVLSTTDRAVVLRELARVVRPRGVLLLSDVEVRPGAVPELAGHQLLGAALCVTDAWRPGELESSLPDAGFTVRRQRDLSASILALVDRAEARLGFAVTAARDMGLDPAQLLASAMASPPGLEGPRIGELAAGVRAAVRRGDLRYVGVEAVRA
jgi:ubiquinone/menaquinone biosynthesis C-methylase UbiE